MSKKIYSNLIARFFFLKAVVRGEDILVRMFIRFDYMSELSRVRGVRQALNNRT